MGKKKDGVHMVFGFLKKKKDYELPLPPPPLPPLIRGDIPPIRAPPQAPEEFPKLLPILNDPLQWESSPERHEMFHPELPAMEKEVPPTPPPQQRGLPVFDKTIIDRTEKETAHTLPAKSFVAVEDYRKIMNETNSIRTKLMNAENFVRKLTELKNDEERTLDKWRMHLEDVEKKLTYVDHVIEKAQR